MNNELPEQLLAFLKEDKQKEYTYQDLAYVFQVEKHDITEAVSGLFFGGDIEYEAAVGLENGDYLVRFELAETNSKTNG